MTAMKVDGGINKGIIEDRRNWERALSIRHVRLRLVNGDYSEMCEES
jgi:hypothetical protein